MIDITKRILGPSERPAAGEAHGERGISVAACAFLLDMAHIGGELSQNGERAIVSILTHARGLKQDEASAVMVDVRKDAPI